ncbi:hypothetical protein ACFL6U_21005 [Planctomycetota bacterium]
MLSKREQLIVLVTIVVLSALVGDRYLLTPLMDKLNLWSEQSQSLATELNEAENLLKQRTLLERKWQKMAGDELVTSSESESHVLNALDRWSQETGLTLSSVKPLRITKVKGSLHEISFAVAGSGSLQATSEFMWQIEKAPLPLRILDLQMGSANESGTEMSVQLNISALTIIDEKASGGKDV